MGPFPWCCDEHLSIVTCYWVEDCRLTEPSVLLWTFEASPGNCRGLCNLDYFFWSQSLSVFVVLLCKHPVNSHHLSWAVTLCFVLVSADGLSTETPHPVGGCPASLCPSSWTKPWQARMILAVACHLHFTSSFATVAFAKQQNWWKHLVLMQIVPTKKPRIF